MDIFKTIIISAKDQSLAQAVDPGSFVTGLSANGKSPATHFIASGYMSEEHLIEIEKIEGSIIRNEDAFSVMIEMSLSIVSDEE